MIPTAATRQQSVDGDTPQLIRRPLPGTSNTLEIDGAEYWVEVGAALEFRARFASIEARKVRS
jgi:hypothetical protein